MQNKIVNIAAMTDIVTIEDVTNYNSYYLSCLYLIFYDIKVRMVGKLCKCFA